MTTSLELSSNTPTLGILSCDTIIDLPEYNGMTVRQFILYNVITEMVSDNIIPDHPTYHNINIHELSGHFNTISKSQQELYESTSAAHRNKNQGVIDELTTNKVNYLLRLYIDMSSNKSMRYDDLSPEEIQILETKIKELLAADNFPASVISAHDANIKPDSFIYVNGARYESGDEYVKHKSGEFSGYVSGLIVRLLIDVLPIRIENAAFSRAVIALHPDATPRNSGDVIETANINLLLRLKGVIEHRIRTQDKVDAAAAFNLMNLLSAIIDYAELENIQVDHATILKVMFAGSQSVTYIGTESSPPEYITSLVTNPAYEKYNIQAGDIAKYVGISNIINDSYIDQPVVIDSDCQDKSNKCVRSALLSVCNKLRGLVVLTKPPPLATDISHLTKNETICATRILTRKSTTDIYKQTSPSHLIGYIKDNSSAETLMGYT